MCRWVLFGIIVLGTVAAVLAKPRGYDTRYYGREVLPVAVDKIWVSTTGDMNAAASYSPSGVPVNTDSLYFTGSANGGSDVSATINVTALNALTLAEVHVMPGYPGDLGTVGTALQIGDNATTAMIHQGSGTLFYGGTVQFLVIDSANTVQAAHISSNVSLGMAVRSGHVTYKGAVACASMTVTQFRDRPSVVEFQGSTGNLTNVRMDGGTIFSSRPQTSSNSPFVIAGGTFVQQRDGGALAVVYLSGGTLVYNTTETLSNVVVMSGLVDFSGDRRAKTVTAMYVHPGGDYIDSNNLTITALYDYRGVVPILP